MRVGLLLVLISRASIASTVANDSLLGQPLEQGLNEFERNGLKLFYSSDLVRGSMLIESVPSSSDPIVAVAQLLQPHGLMLRRGLNDAWLVVRAPREPEPDAAISTQTQTDTDPTPAVVTAPALEELIVAASRYEISRAQATPRRIITARDLEHMPDIGDDVIRTVTRLPGISSNGFSALSHFRGGELTETLVRFDGLRLYDPFHLRDFQSVFSAIDPRIVSSMDIYTGGFPATFGDRMSGVVDVASMTTDRDIYHEVGASFFNTSFLSSGRFADQRAGWLVSVRRSNLEELYDRFSDQPDRPRYSDVFAKLRFDVSDSLSVTANILLADDKITLADDLDREENATADQSDSYHWLRFDHSAGGLTSGSTLVSRTRLASSRVGSTEKVGVSTGRMDDDRSFSITTVQSDWSRLIGARMLLDFGASVSRLRGTYDYTDEVEFDLLFDMEGAATSPTRYTRISLQPYGRQHALYSTLRVDWNSRVASEFGLRWNDQSIDGVASSTLGPRLAVRYNLNERATLRASWGKFYQSQAINELPVSDGIDTFSPPQRSDQFVVGFDRQFAGGTVLRVEAYHKAMSRLRPRFENALNSRVLLPELKPDRIRIQPGSATARGIEVAINATVGNFKWWGSLSRARVTDDLAGRNVLRSWDQTYSLSAGFFRDTGKWTMSSALTWRTGWPTSTVVALDESVLPSAAIPNHNDARLDTWRSLDVRLSRDFRFERSDLSLFFELSNITGHRNPCCFEFEIGDEEDAGQLILDELAYLPSIPSVGFLWRF